MAELLCRWSIFLGALGVSLVPAWLGLTILPQLIAFPRLLNAAVIWYLAALVPAGFTRAESGGTIWLADTAWLVCLVFWAAVGFAYARTLLAVPRAVYLALVLPLLFATGFGTHLLLRAAGVVAYAGV